MTTGAHKTQSASEALSIMLRQVEQLTAERDALQQNEIQSLGATLRALAERDSAIEERDALLLDARRYRWLRARGTSVNGTWLFKGFLDDVIDDEMHASTAFRR